MIDQWFPTVVCHGTLEPFLMHNTYLAEKAYLLKEEYPNAPSYWRCDTYNTMNVYSPFNDNDQIINNLIDICKKEVLIFSKEYGIDKTINDLVCNDFWFNISGPDSYQEYHQHTDSHFSLVYYVQAYENCGNIIFKSIESVTDMMPLPVKDNSKSASFKTCFYKPTNSTILIFRSNLLHMVEKNYSDKDRISIAMNFKFIS